jgi:putative FmdB family regulatory protein
MPLYEFQCDNCGANVELLIRGGEQPKCTGCGSERLTKQLSAPAAPVISGGQLPIQAGGGCGRPQCGTGGCAGLGM